MNRQMILNSSFGDLMGFRETSWVIGGFFLQNLVDSLEVDGLQALLS